MTERIKRLNWVIRGWINYFRMGNMKDAMSKIDEWMRTRIRIIIWKQWKTREKRLWGLMKLGVPEWMARQSAGFGDHYQAVARTTGLRKISKEILAKRGLISCLDYYLNWTAVCRTARTVVWEGLLVSPYSICVHRIEGLEAERAWAAGKSWIPRSRKKTALIWIFYFL